METVIESATWKARVVPTDSGFRVSTPAEPFVVRMAHVDPDTRLFLACRALRRDEDCIEANVIVAAANESRDARLCCLNIAVEEGERLWTPVLMQSGDEVDLWRIEAARPWLHAIKALGDEFFEAGWFDDARSAYERIQGMDPDDHLDVKANLDRIGPHLVMAG